MRKRLLFTTAVVCLAHVSGAAMAAAPFYQNKVDDGVLAVRRVMNNSLQVEEDGGRGQLLIEVARADFDGDGIEDILVFEHSYATHDTFGSGSVLLLTRSSENARFKVARLRV